MERCFICDTPFADGYEVKHNGETKLCCGECYDLLEKMEALESVRELGDSWGKLEMRMFNGISEESRQFLEKKHSRLEEKVRLRDPAWQDQLRKKEEEQKIEEKKKTFLLTTANAFAGYQVVRYLNLVHGEIVLGTGFFKGLSASVSGVLGTDSAEAANRLAQARDKAQERMTEKAIQNGANGILGVEFDFSMIATSLFVVSCYGTAVILEKES